MTKFFVTSKTPRLTSASSEISEACGSIVTRATCVISGRTVEFHNDSLGYCPFHSREGSKKVIKHYVFRSINHLTYKDFTND